MNRPKNNILQKIYTPISLINHLIQLALQFYRYTLSDISFLEPAAGSGAIVNVLKQTFPDADITAFDIYNETNNPDIQQLDFFKHRLLYKDERICIMNPPFTSGLKFVYEALNTSGLVVSILSQTSFISLDYDKYDVKLIELIKGQKFTDGNLYDICIVVISNK